VTTGVTGDTVMDIHVQRQGKENGIKRHDARAGSTSAGIGPETRHAAGSVG